MSWGKQGVYEQVINYPSVDRTGAPLVLSGKISVPTARKPKGLILLPHYTIASNNEVPSTSNTDEARYFRKDYVLVMPDYLGYGVTRDSVHPYLCGELTAKHCVDMLIAAIPLLDSLKVPLETDTLCLVGFSQGAAVALWTLKLLEEQYADRFYVKACYAGSGPYDVAATYDYAVQHNKVGMAMTIPQLVMGTSAAYGLGLKREVFFTPAMNKRYDKYITSKKYSFIVLGLLMADKKADHWLSAYGLDKTNPDSHRMYDGFLRSSLVHYPVDDLPVGSDTICPAWTPRADVYVFHSERDDIVPFCNAEHLRRCLGDKPNVTYDYGKYGGHLSSKIKFFRIVSKLID